MRREERGRGGEEERRRVGETRTKRGTGSLLGKSTGGFKNNKRIRNMEKLLGGPGDKGQCSFHISGVPISAPI